MKNSLISFKSVRPFLVSCAFFMAQFLFVVGVMLVGGQPAWAAEDADYLQKLKDLGVLGQEAQHPNPNFKDSLGFFQGECTSYVAYRLNNTDITYRGLKFTNDWGFSNNLSATNYHDKTHWSHGYNWGGYARGIGYAVDNKPVIGSVVHMDGHVAIVASPLDNKGTSDVSDDTVGIEEYNWGTADHSYNSRSINVSSAEYIHLERSLPGGWWRGDTPVNYSPIERGAKTTIYVHAEDKGGGGMLGNGGLQTVKITAKEFRNGSETGDPWRVIKEVTYITPNKASDDIDALYDVPMDLDYVLISFDVYSYDRETGALSFQKAPNGGRELYASEFKQERLAQGKTVPFLSIASPLYYDPNYTFSGSIGESPVGGQPPSSCTPGANQAAVFTEKDYQGNCVVKDLGDYSSPEAIGLPNDSISSIKVGSGANVRLCENSGLNSPCEYFPADDPDFSNNGTVHDNTVSSMKVEGGAPTTGCVPNENQAAFFMDTNYAGTCIVKGIGTYNDPGAINLPNDSISSIKVGAKAKVRVCNNSGMNSPCEYFDYDDPDLSNNSIGDNTISSAGVEFRGGIALCDGTNYGGPCKWFGTGKYNMQDQGFNDITESVQFDANWANKYHIVLWTEANQTGNSYHADNNVADLGSTFRNHVRSIEIYPHTPPNASTIAPANGSVLPANTTSVLLNYSGGTEKHVHVWSNSYDVTSPWAASDSYTAINLTPGTYSWQVQGRNEMGDGAWSVVSIFTINTPPVVWGGNLTVDAGTTQTVQVQASDVDGNPLTFSASGLPAFAIFTDNHNGIGMLTVAPGAGNAGQYAISVTASDGDATSSGVINISVAAPVVQGFQGEYFANRSLSGTPVLTRMDSAIDFDWGLGSPDASVPADNFSARWTKAINFAAGTYEFKATADDGVRLYIDDVPVIDKWIDQGATAYTVNKILSEGTHTIKMEYYENGGNALAKLNYQQLPDAPPSGGNTPPSSETINLDWHLARSGGSAEDYQSVAQDILKGKQSITLTYNLHGLCALGGDASAIIFDQGGWRYVSLSNYGQNCFDGEQTITIPLSDFPNLDTNAALNGSFHTRFWYSGPFIVDILSVKFNEGVSNPNPVASTIVFDSSSVSQEKNNLSSVTLSHTTSSIENGFIIVGLQIRNGSNGTFARASSCSYNGSNLIRAKAQNGDSATGRYISSEIWYGINPAPGTYDVVCNFPSPVKIAIIGASTYSGVDQVNPLDAVGGNNNANSSRANVDLSITNNNSLVVDSMEGAFDDPINVGLGQTQLWQSTSNSGGDHVGSSYKFADAGLATMFWSSPLGSDEWASSAASFKPANN